MDTNDIQEFRYSVTDVIFEDVGDVSVPSEHQALFDEYCSEVDSFLVETPMWRTSVCGYKSCMLEKSRHKAYTKSLLCSGDEGKIRAAVEAMLHTVDRYFDSAQTEKAMKERQADRIMKRLLRKDAHSTSV